MSQENVERVRQGFERFVATGRTDPDIASPGFVWDMSNFDGWPERQTYEGDEEVQGFSRIGQAPGTIGGSSLMPFSTQVTRSSLWCASAGTRSRLGCRSKCRSQWSGRCATAEQTRMDMYSDRGEAFEAAGLSE